MCREKTCPLPKKFTNRITFSLQNSQNTNIVHRNFLSLIFLEIILLLPFPIFVLLKFMCFLLRNGWFLFLFCMCYIWELIQKTGMDYLCKEVTQALFFLFHVFLMLTSLIHDFLTKIRSTRFKIFQNCQKCIFCCC